MEIKVTQKTKDLLSHILTQSVAPVEDKEYPTAVLVRDPKGPGGAHHEYVVLQCNKQGEPVKDKPIFAKIVFQKGGRDVSVNGCTNEDLIGIVMHRLSCFQSGPFPCNENELALEHLNAAMSWLVSRTEERTARGVEGREVT